MSYKKKENKMTPKTLEIITYKGKTLHEITSEERDRKRLLGRVYGHTTEHCLALAAEHCTGFSKAKFFYKHHNKNSQSSPNFQSLTGWEKVYPNEPAPQVRRPTTNLRIDFYAESRIAT